MPIRWWPRAGMQWCRQNFAPLSPNPVSIAGTLQIQGSEDAETKIDILGMDGKVIRSQTFNGSVIQMEAPSVAGIYIVRIGSQGKTRVQKLSVVR